VTDEEIITSFQQQVERRLLLMERQGRGHPPIFRRMIEQRYAGKDDTPETFDVRAFMRGFAYMIVLRESISYRPKPRTSRPRTDPVRHDHRGEIIWDRHNPML